MVKKGLFFFLLLVLLTSCDKHSTTQTDSSEVKKATTTQKGSSKKSSQAPQKMLSISKVKTYIQNAEKGKNVSFIHIIFVKNIGEVGAAFASFKIDGKLKYVTIFSSKQQGNGTAVFTVSDFKKDPIQYVEQSGENGYTSITGVIDHKSGIKKISITFSNGQVKEVPVVGDEFWFFGKAGSTEKEVYSREVIGVTTNGSLVVKKNKQ